MRGRGGVATIYRVKRLLIAALFLLGCSKNPAPAQDAPATVASTPIADAAPAPAVLRYSYATFAARNVLEECIDLVVEVPNGVDAGKLAQPERMVPKESTRISRDCGAQFAARTSLATCELHKTNDAGTGLSMREFKYDADALVKSDTAMKECLALGGTWDELPRNSPAWRRARLERLQRLADQASE